MIAGLFLLAAAAVIVLPGVWLIVRAEFRAADARLQAHIDEALGVANAPDWDANVIAFDSLGRSANR